MQSSPNVVMRIRIGRIRIQCKVETIERLIVLRALETSLAVQVLAVGCEIAPHKQYHDNDQTEPNHVFTQKFSQL